MPQGVGLTQLKYRDNKSKDMPMRYQVVGVTEPKMSVWEEGSEERGRFYISNNKKQSKIRFSGRNYPISKRAVYCNNRIFNRDNHVSNNLGNGSAVSMYVTMQ